MDISNNINKLFYDLVKIKSDTSTVYERDIEQYIYDWLKDLDYYATNPDKFGKYSLKGDNLNHSVVWGLVKGWGNKTIILMHHHDVVDSSDYGVLSEYAYTPDKLIKAMNKINLSEDVKKDLESNDWVFGRGTADMKAGAAIQLALLEKYSNIKDLNGNILLLSVPDEESLSKGMRESAYLLEKLKEKFDLEYILMINSEPHEREKPNQGVLHEGSVGKITPVVYVRGKRVHVKDVFKGVNPILILSEIVKKTELNPEFSDVVEGEITPPPSWIQFKDSKEVYDVSTPEGAGGYFSILTLKKTPKEVINQLKNICEDGFKEALKNMKINYRKYCDKGNIKIQETLWPINVKTYSEIYNEALEQSGDLFLKDYNYTLVEVKKALQDNKINMPEGTLMIIKKVLEYTADMSPVVVIGLSPPYYPHVSNQDFTDISTVTNGLFEKIEKYVDKNWNEDYLKLNYFMGISDMSYTNINDSDKVISYIKSNMPLWGDIYHIPFDKIKKLKIPSINIGPWGKDIHKVTERVFKKDLFERIPQIIDFVIKEAQGRG